MESIKKLVITFVIILCIFGMWKGCKKIIPNKFYGYVPENVTPQVEYQVKNNDYIRDESILVVDKNSGDTLKARYPEVTVFNILKDKGIHPLTINKKVYVQYYMDDGVPWVQQAYIDSAFWANLSQ